jgi:hypothetical protein
LGWVCCCASEDNNNKIPHPPYTCWRLIKKGSSPIVWIKNVTLLKVVNAQESGHPLSWPNVLKGLEPNFHTSVLDDLEDWVIFSQKFVTTPLYCLEKTLDNFLKIVINKC